MSSIKSKANALYEVQDTDLIPLINDAGTTPVSVTAAQLMANPGVVAANTAAITAFAAATGMVPSTFLSIRGSDGTVLFSNNATDWVVTRLASGTYVVEFGHTLESITKIDFHIQPLDFGMVGTIGNLTTSQIPIYTTVVATGEAEDADFTFRLNDYGTYV